MNKKTFPLLLLLILSFASFSQKYNKLSEVPLLKKGRIVLTDGKSIKFLQLKVTNDTVEFVNTSNSLFKYSKTDVYLIYKNGNRALGFSAGFGLIGLGSAIAVVMPSSSTLTSSQKTSVIIYTTLA